jgi:hypothetical protein
MTLTKREVSTLIRLLGVLQTNLESAIESSTLPDGSFDEHATPELKRDIAKDRRDWKQAEELVAKLDAARRANRK